MVYELILFINHILFTPVIYNITDLETLSILVIYLSIHFLSNQVCCILGGHPIIKLNSVNPGMKSGILINNYNGISISITLTYDNSLLHIYAIH